MDAPVKRVCLAYSGGLDTSVILRWLIDRYDCEVVAYTADVGQEEELDGLPEKARDTGAVDCQVRDLREEFARDFVFPAIAGGAVYEGTYLLGTALARPLIAKHHAEVARATGCDAVAHGVGVTDEYPMIQKPMDWDAQGYDGVVEENMTLCVESYMGVVGGADGVKLEEQIVVTANGAELLSTFPFEENLLSSV